MNHQPTNVVSVRFGAEEMEKLKEVAARDSVPLSTVVRRAVIAPTSPTVSFAPARTASSSSVGAMARVTMGTTSSTINESAPGGNVRYDGPQVY